MGTNKTIEYIANKYGVTIDPKYPTEIRNTGRRPILDTFKEMGFKVGVEVGVAEGIYAEEMLKRIPNLKLFGVDIWKSYGTYNEYLDREDKCYQEAVERTKGYDCTLIRKFSMDAVKNFEDNSLDFVYIDSAHDFKSVTDDVLEWSKKVKIGGVVYGHDYKRRHRKWIVDVKDVLPSLCYAKRVNPLFIIGEPSNRDDGMFKDGSRSWLFVRQHNDLINYTYDPYTKEENYGSQREVDFLK